MVICLKRDADLHMAQLMPLPLIVSSFSKIQIGFTFLVPAHLGIHGKMAVKWVCLCNTLVVYVSVVRPSYPPKVYAYFATTATATTASIHLLAAAIPWREITGIIIVDDRWHACNSGCGRCWWSRCHRRRCGPFRCCRRSSVVYYNYHPPTPW